MDRLNRQAPVQTWNAIFFSQIAMHEQEGMGITFSFFLNATQVLLARMPSMWVARAQAMSKNVFPTI